MIENRWKSDKIRDLEPAIIKEKPNSLILRFNQSYTKHLTILERLKEPLSGG